jgi:hypothetical protein
MCRYCRLVMAIYSSLLSLAPSSLYRGCSICRYFSSLYIIDIAIFLRRWWFLRKRLSRDWSHGARNGISQTDFLRLLVVVTTVIIFYLPVSIIAFILNLLLPCPREFSWEKIHDQWGIILKEPISTVDWGCWIVPVTAISLFSLVGITRTSKHLFELLIEWIYDHSPSILKKRLSWMRNISAKCKQLRLAVATDAELQDDSI